MTLNDAIDLATEGIFLLIGVLTLIDWLRWRDRPRFDIVLVFGSLAVLFLMQDLQEAGWLGSETLGLITAAVVLAHPYLLLRVAADFRPLPRWAHWAALGGFLATIVSVVLVGDAEPPPTIYVVVIGVYFAGVEAYASFRFVAGALRAAGVPRRRLTLAAAGAGFLAAVIPVAILGSWLPAAKGITDAVAAISAVLSGLSFYVGFAPPRSLRRAWQMNELYRFLQQNSQGTTPGNVNVVQDNLCEAALRATGGLQVLLARWDAANEELLVHGPAGTAEESGLAGDLRRLWDERRPAFAAPARKLGAALARRAQAAGAVEVYITPIGVAGRTPWGLLLLFQPAASPFAADDLQLLMLLAEQSATALDYVALIGEQSRLIGELEKRTGELEALNRELETFSYSVSHDLRAPLRSLAGFSQALLEDYGDKLDEGGQDFLRRIRAAAGRMGALIDGLLEMSRLARAELRREEVDLGAVAHSVAEELQRSEPERQVEFDIAPGVAAQGDARLLRVVVENLIGNAWKFTSKRDRARIEFGARKISGRPVYYVRDNGAGFDTAHTHQLFVAFQRLHRSTEFPGTGIGLATVERIINRHGGQICAEGSLGQGAAFHFTLS